MQQRWKPIAWLALTLGIALALLLALRGLQGRRDTVDDAGLQEVRSAQGAFTLSVEPGVLPIPMNQMHAWTLRLTAGDGKPLENAVITVDGGMPAHGHGLPTQPQVTKELGEGAYLLEGLRFQMPGEWVVNIHVRAAGVNDTAVVRFTLR